MKQRQCYLTRGVVRGVGIPTNIYCFSTLGSVGSTCVHRLLDLSQLRGISYMLPLSRKQWQKSKDIHLKLHRKQVSAESPTHAVRFQSLALSFQAAWTMNIMFTLHSKHSTHSCEGESEQACFNSQAK